MPRSANRITLLLLSIIAALSIVSVALIPTSATTQLQLQPSSVLSGDAVQVFANVARNGSTVTLSYYADLNKNGKDDDGGPWTLITNVTDNGANDALNTTSGFVAYTWMTPSLSPGQYIVKVEDPYGPTRTTALTVNYGQLKLVPAIYGPKGVPDKGLVNPGDSFSVITSVEGNCRLCHQTDNPTTQNPGVDNRKVQSQFSADLSQTTGSSTDTAVAPDYIHHKQVQWAGIASKLLADNQTIDGTVTGKNPAGNAVTQSKAFAGVNKAVNIPPTSNYQSGQGSASAKAAGSSNPLPGFEAVFAVAGLTLVAYLISRRR
jgi:PGF-CTERM protein